MGCSDGIADGENEAVGCSDGIADGASEGLAVGCSDGIADGASEGLAVGFNLVGLAVGDSLELAEQAHALLFQLSADTEQPYTASSYVPPKYQQPLPP